MKIEDQVCTPEQSALLIFLGVGEHSFWFWTARWMPFQTDKWILDYHRHGNQLPAFSVAELGLCLPDEILVDLKFSKEWVNYKDGQFLLTLDFWKFDKDEKNKFSEAGFGIQYRQNNNINKAIPQGDPLIAKTEAEVRAKMVIYLLQKQIISPDEVNKRLENYGNQKRTDPKASSESSKLEPAPKVEDDKG